MNIILGKPAIEAFENNYTVLELDTVTIGNSAPITAYCVVETIPIDELPRTESLKKMHASLMEQYRARNWSFCEDALGHLFGAWNGEIDTFYSDLLSRINNYKLQEPDALWSGIVQK